MTARLEDSLYERTYAVIMAGGTGTRFWPASRVQRPKQFLPLVGGQSLLQLTVDRLKGLSAPERHRLVTGTMYETIAREQLSTSSDRTFILERIGKNTAPCVALSAQLIALEEPDAVMMVLPSDHYIRDVESFQKTLARAVQRADDSEALLTIGIKANRPETGYGYIETGECLDEHTHPPVYRADRFHEKPDLKTAIQFLESGSFLWNSGMFVWKVSTILKAFEQYQPGMYSKLEAIRNGDRRQETIDQFYQEAESLSIDYGIMEHAESIEVLPGDFGWSDLGSWESVRDMANNRIAGLDRMDGPVIAIDSENLFTRAGSGKLIAVVGVSDIAVIDTEDALLICKLDKSQQVKEVVQELQKQDTGKSYL
ncbi:MAG: mannose-1-phosphate guanylyltransferase [Balneolaceae bacterium]